MGSISWPLQRHYVGDQAASALLLVVGRACRMTHDYCLVDAQRVQQPFCKPRRPLVARTSSPSAQDLTHNLAVEAHAGLRLSSNQ